ncbi:MAG: energy-coupling factor transporter transmembrane component T [Pseudoclavibacter sp.]|nr:energy-coupling factor transporter transmembrane component T [Pseudoclavibacter sp.]
MIPVHRPGASPLHRLAAGRKLLLLALLAIALSLPGAPPLLLGCGAVLCLGGFLLAGLGALEPLRQIVAMRWLVLFLWLAQMFFVPLAQAATTTGRLVLLVLLANLLSLTTSPTELLEALERALGVLRPLGIRPGRVALVLSLAITSVPVVAGLLAQVREAQLARGVRLAPHRAVVPLLALALRHADQLAEAITARGVEP